VVLRDEVNGKVMLMNFYIGQLCRLFKQGSLYFPTGEVFIVQYPVFRMPSFTPQVVVLGFILVKASAPANDFSYALRPFFYHYFYDVPVAKAVAGIKGILNMLVKGVFLKIPYGSNAALCVAGVAFVVVSFGKHSDFEVGSGGCQVDSSRKAANT
jgi:hypothetical protein